MGLFDKLKGPEFLKEESDAVGQLKRLKELLSVASPNVKKQIEHDIKLLEYGIIGENQVAFELKNSFMPMYVLRDLYYEYDGLTAQIDYLIITKKLSIVIECKNLFGNIEINAAGDFIRTTDFGYGKKKEGIYSPITQNRRHLDLIKRMRGEDKGNIIIKTLFDNNFENAYKSLVVLANEKTILNMKYARKEIKNQIIRCDQLVDNIKRLQIESKQEPSSEKDMLQRAEYFLDKHTQNMTDYTKKYQLKQVEESEVIENETIENTPFYKALKEYRYKKSKEENIRAYYIFTNAQMEDIIQKKPCTMESIKEILPYGDIKCAKYGVDILTIVKEYGFTPY